MSGKRPIVRRAFSVAIDPDTPRDWFAGDAYGSTLLNALSLMFPEGERFFVESVRRYRDRVADPALRQRVDGFIGQEAMHGKAHRELNRWLEPELGAGVERDLRVVLDAIRRLPPRVQLGVTCALEHFTAIMAAGLFDDPRQHGAMHPQLRPLWLWHAFEESEHKAVAFDVYQLAAAPLAERRAVMAATTAVFFAAVLVFHLRLMAPRGLLTRPWRWLRGLDLMWGRTGHFRRLVPAYLAFYRRGFHPDDLGGAAQLERWRAWLFDGELAGRVAEAA